ncbi:MAG: transposase [Ekhidna sp.]|uniref:transposase n=1 Tax=Ekhidna sp. TaxID=2608089 RepID=UPI0032ED05E9
MSELGKANTDATYFLTFTVVGWIDVFTRNRYSDIIIDSLKFCIQNKGLDIFSYVIMPSHIHMIARHEEGKLNEIIRDFKSFTAKEIIRTIELITRLEPSDCKK